MHTVEPLHKHRRPILIFVVATPMPTSLLELVSEMHPIFFNQHFEAFECPEVRIQKKLSK